MSINQRLQEQAVSEAETAFLTLSRQLDHLFNLTSFYLDKNPQLTHKEFFISTELFETANNLGSLTLSLAQIVSSWKLGNFSTVPKQEVRNEVLGEIWANAQPIICLLLRHEIDLEPFSLEEFKKSLQTLASCNRLLSAG
jgi:hypothetical protein